ncbi:MAG UNVERIFIED_CONTAM: hypothetical protein LVR18_37440 [Planctomycetaceae bacterium]
MSDARGHCRDLHTNGAGARRQESSRCPVIPAALKAFNLAWDTALLTMTRSPAATNRSRKVRTDESLKISCSLSERADVAMEQVA